VKELLKSDSICESYAQMQKGSVFLTRRVYVAYVTVSLVLTGLVGLEHSLCTYDKKCHHHSHPKKWHS